MKTQTTYIFQEMSREKFEKKYPGVIEENLWRLDEFRRPVITGVAITGTEEQAENSPNDLNVDFKFHELVRGSKKQGLSYMCKVGDLK